MLNAKIAEITRANAEANFTLAIKLAESKDVARPWSCRASMCGSRWTSFVHQLEEMRDLATQVIQDSTRPRRSRHAPTARSNASSSSERLPSARLEPATTGQRLGILQLRKSSRDRADVVEGLVMAPPQPSRIALQIRIVPPAGW